MPGASLDFLRDIMERRGAACTPEEFQQAVNVTFHRFESEVYDELHQDMWQSLPGEIARLVDAAAAKGYPAGERLRALDIGCGTGLATDALLRSGLGARVEEVTLLDTSAQMLRRATARAAGWTARTRPVEGLLAAAEDGPFDVIITSSVLHHVPDIGAFLGEVARRQRPGGLFLHVQDPNGDAAADPELERRSQQMAARRPPEWKERLTPQRVAGRLKRMLTGALPDDYISRTLRQLVADGVVREPLTVAELYRITDIHVHNGAGISARRVGAALPDYELAAARAYGFFGEMPSTLPEDLAREERRLSESGSLAGAWIGAAWGKRA